ncbi:hypothetical protein C8J57DRAFT_1341451 [Mycena rebaudengoi]|nr:hypothetical protein C8J57DRAFT_1341451 [Mycena rebaudengoi]
MHIVKSPFPPLPPLPEVNIFHMIFGRADQAEWPDYTIQIDAATGRGDEMVGLIGDNSLNYVDTVMALLVLATPFALISSYSTPFEMVHALKLTKATRLFVDARLVSRVLQALKDPGVHIKPENVYVLAGKTSGARKSLAGMVEQARKGGWAEEEVRPAKRDTLAYLVMSSGTSGLPKAVQITHGNVVASLMQGITAAVIAEPFSPNSKTSVTNADAPPTHPITLAVLPMFHSYGLHVYILRATLYPATFVIMERWNTEAYLRAIEKFRATHLTLIPSAVHQLVSSPLINKIDLSSVQLLNSGAAHLAPELAARMRVKLRKDADISQGYGLSEGTIAAITRGLPGMLGMGAPPAGATGILLPGLDARISGGAFADSAVGEVGELCLRGPNVTPGYWNNDKANADAFFVDEEGSRWLRTGDLFRVDEGGYFFFADRGKDTLKISGEQVSPAEIEDTLFALPGALVSDVCVAGVSGLGRTADEKVPRAWVVLSPAGKREGEAAVIKKLEAWHRERLSRWKWLRGGIEVVKEIPKTPTGKTMRRVLQERYEQRQKKGKGKSRAKL